MKKRFTYGLLFLLFWSLLTSSSFAQDRSRQVQELEKKAEQLLKDGNYVQAKDAYSTLLSNHPKDPFYSYRFGVCLLYGDRRDIQKPIPYLELAAKNKEIEPEVYFYLGQAYHFNYRFADAIRMYEKYKTLVPKNKVSRLDVDRQIEMCRNGLNLLYKVKDLYVLERTEVSIRDFYRAYDLKDFGGEILQEPPGFKSKFDKKHEVSGLVFFPEKQDIVLFSSYGEGDKTGKDIYGCYFLPDQTWSKPQKIPGKVNTEYDEDYPFLTPDGQTLYFASKGHNSMGGYDIFRSALDTLTGYWSEPENLDFAINTPMNDILFVTDPDQKTAYFASDRSTVADKLMVHLVRIDLRPDRVVKLELAQQSDGNAATSENQKKSLEIIQQMSDLKVNATREELQARAEQKVAVAEPVVTGKTVTAYQQPDYKQTMDQKIEKAAIAQHYVDTAFQTIKKMEFSLDELDDFQLRLLQIYNTTPDSWERDMALHLSNDLTKEIDRKETKLKENRKMAAELQYLAATGKTDSVATQYKTFRDRVAPADTVVQYADYIRDVAANQVTMTVQERNEDVVVGSLRNVKDKSAKEKLNRLMIKTEEMALAEQIEETETLDKEEVAVNQEDITAGEDSVLTVITDTTSQVSKLIDNTESGYSLNEESRVSQALDARQDSLQLLIDRTQRQEQVLAQRFEEKKSESEDLLSEVEKKEKRMQSQPEEIQETLRGETENLRNQARKAAEEAVISYELAQQLKERQKDLRQHSAVLDSVEDKLKHTTKAAEKQEILAVASSVIDSVKNNEIAEWNDNDIVSGLEEKKDDLQSDYLDGYRVARDLALRSDSIQQWADDLSQQAGQTPDRQQGKRLGRKSFDIGTIAAEKQGDAVTALNQAGIMENQYRVIENALPSIQDVLTEVNDRADKPTVVKQQKKTKPNVLNQGDVNEILTRDLPVLDTSYVAALPASKKVTEAHKPTTEVLLARTEQVAAASDTLFVLRQEAISDSLPPAAEAIKIVEAEQETEDEKQNIDLELHDVQQDLSDQPSVDVIARWERNKTALDQVKTKVDSLFELTRRQPDLRLSQETQELINALKLRTDSIASLFEEYREARVKVQKEPEKEKIAMFLELEGFEVKAARNKLNYLNNRQKIIELSEGLTIMEKAAINEQQGNNAEYYFSRSEALADSASGMTDPVKKSEVLSRAETYQQLGVREQSDMMEKMQQKVIAVQEVKQAQKEADLKNQQVEEPEKQVVVRQDVKTAEQKTIPSAPVAQKIPLGTPVAMLSGVEIQALREQLRESANKHTLPSMPGLMFTVQIGVYKTQRSSERLFGITPLFEDMTGNGYYRYFSGIFGNKQDAIAYKNEVVSKGVPDAFVVVFYQGRKISLAEANTLAGESIDKVIPKAEREPLLATASEKPALRVYFSVQLAAYKRPATPEETRKYEARVGSKVSVTHTESGYYVLTIGEYVDYVSSQQARQKVIKAGINDAFIIGYVNGKRVMAYQAREALKTSP